MRPLRLLLASLLCLSVWHIPASARTDIQIPDITYQKFVLENGLTLIVHEDHKAPIVAVNLWYHVGSKNETPGKTGFAHLFEHLMFNGSENFNDDYFKALERVGATDLNGTTNYDRTNYFQNVPASALDLVLFLESDRMGHFLGAVDQDRLDEQRGVVQNEKRQGENRPYGKDWTLITENCFPKGHPYSWSVIGSMEDLDAASMEDVQTWFNTYYGTANAVISISGDVEADDIKARVVKYFGDIPSGPPLTKHEAWIAKRTGEQRLVTEDRVPQTRIYKVWNVPEWGTDAAVHFDLITDILASGKSSRLYKRLVFDDQIASDVAAYLDQREIASLVIVTATAHPGQDLRKVEAALDEELDRFLKSGPTKKEIERVQTQKLAGFIRGVERIGGFGGKSDILAMNEVYADNPGFYKRILQRVKAATPAVLLKTAREWLSDGAFVLEVHPFPEHSVTESDVDRSKLPNVATPPDARFPDLQRATLANGLDLILAERRTVPSVSFHLLVDAGFASDHLAKPSTARTAMNMLNEGTTSRTALELTDELALLGANLSSSSSLDVSNVTLSALKDNLDPALEIYADVILNPAFTETDLQRIKKNQIAALKRSKANPFQMAMRVFPKLIYGEAHAYSQGFTGTTTEADINALTRQGLKAFHETWFKPNNAALVIVGDITLTEIQPKLEKIFKSWQQGDVPTKNIKTVTHQEKPVVYLMDKPGAIQSVIAAGHISPPKANPTEIAIETMNGILGGNFTARINMNLREDKHWSYGAWSFLSTARGQRPFIVLAPVQTDKTKEAMAEIDDELRGLLTDRPPTEDELSKVVQNRTQSLAGRWETARAVSGSIADLVRYGLPDDYHTTYAEKVRSVSLDEVNAAAKDVVRPDNLVWLVVGDREEIETSIRDLDYGQIRLIDTDGNPVD